MLSEGGGSIYRKGWVNILLVKSKLHKTAPIPPFIDFCPMLYCGYGSVCYFKFF